MNKINIKNCNDLTLVVAWCGGCVSVVVGVRCWRGCGCFDDDGGNY